MMVISQYRFGLYNIQIDKLFNWIHGNNVGTLCFVGTLHATSLHSFIPFTRIINNIISDPVKFPFRMN